MNVERPIEKLLRRYAQKRRDEAGDPPLLHPATRRLLQGEVARQFPKPQVDRNPSVADFLARLTQRWIYAVGLFVVLGVAAAVFLPGLTKSKDRALLAQKSSSEDLMTRETVRPLAAPAIEPAPLPAESQPSLIADNSRRDRFTPEPSGGGNYLRPRNESIATTYTATNGLTVASRLADAKQIPDSFRKREEPETVSLGTTLDANANKPGTVTVIAPSRTAGEKAAPDSLALNRPGAAGRAGTGIATDGRSESRQILVAPTVAAAAPTDSSPGVQDKAYFARGGGLEKDAEWSYAQSFANVAPEQLRAKAAKVNADNPVVPVLASFQVQQNGNELRVIDSDGSTYLGAANIASANYGVAGSTGKEMAVLGSESADRRRTQAPASAASATQQQIQNYQWRVEGTNRTLNQNVVFTWNFVEMSNAIAASEMKAISGTFNQDASKLPSQFPMMLQNSFINGRAQFGPGREIEVNAVPVKP
jgi:hypothetical protein